MSKKKRYNAASLAGAAFFILSFSLFSNAQFRRVDTIPVTENTHLLKMPWVGGHNFCQFSEIDVNFDGKKDLFVFDRSGFKISVYINKGTPNTVDYVDSSSKYVPMFPHLEDWALIRDYNNDGLPDIFTSSINNNGIKVWRNISSGGHLQFTLQTSMIQTDYTPANTSDPLSDLYISPVDLPTIDDIDGDGDLDILTFDMSNIYLEWHINKSLELSYGNDSLIFQMNPGCWGNFNENPSGCKVNLNAGCMITHPDSNAYEKKRSDYLSEVARARHAGNCSVCFDEDGDGDMDVILGQLACCNFIKLTNGGSSTLADMISKDTLFPSYDIPADFSSFTCGYFLDLNNDGKRDLIVAPNAPNISVNNSSIWYYQNVGTNTVPVFSRQSRNLFQNEMIDVGEGADPVFFDFNQDGLTDLLISNYTESNDSCSNTYNYTIRAYKNTGTASSPKFDLFSTDYANTSSQLPGIKSKHLTFGDIDGDGDPDMMTGDFDGYIHYFKNNGGAGNPCNFTLAQQNYTDNNGVPIDVGKYSTPQLIDVDRDGKLDLIIGEQAGNVNYFHNIGTTTSPSFQHVTDTLGGVDVLKPCCTGYSIPFMFDSAGSYRLIVGSEANRQNNNKMNWIWYYKNIDGNLGGHFTVVDSMYQKIWEGTRMAVNGSDINNDGRMDLVIGNSCGGVAIYMGDTSTVFVHEVKSALNSFVVYPNPSPGNINISISQFKQNEKYELTLYNSIGETVASYLIRNSESRISLQLPNGVYTCSLKTKNVSSFKKIIIVK